MKNPVLGPEPYMRPFVFVICLVMLLPLQALRAAVDIESITALPDYSRDYDPDRNPFDDGREALELAKRTDRLVMIEVGGEWCRWCLVLDNFIQKHNAVYTRLHENFVLLKVNVSDDNENTEFFEGLPRANGYPHVFISRSNGGLIGSTDLTRLVVDGDYDEPRFLGFLQHWIELSSLTSNTNRVTE